MSLDRRVLALLGFTAVIGCAGPDNTPPFDNADGGVDCVSGCDAGDDMNRAPTVQFGDMSRNARVGTPKDFIVNASDPDGDDVECDYDFGDENRSGYGPCSVQHTYGAEGDYNVGVTARDSRGLEGSTRAGFRAYRNIPPTAVLNCEERAADGKCVYRARTWENVCVDGSESFDEDGRILLYTIEPTIGGFTSSGPESLRCMNGGPEPGTYNGRYHVEDNEGLRNFVDFRSIVTE